MINDSKEESDKRSIELYRKVVANAIADYLVQNPTAEFVSI